MIITMLAWAGAFLSCLLTIPQAVRTLHSERLEGLSATTYWIVLGNALVWASWSVLTEEYAAGVPALVNGPAAALILHRLQHRHLSVAPIGPARGRRCLSIGVALRPAPAVLVGHTCPS